MENSFQTSIVFVGLLCFSSLAHIAQSEDNFLVEGQVYCDTCRAQFITRLSEYISGAKVRLECREPEGGAVTFSTEGDTDETGTYHLTVTGDHEDEVCDVTLVSSPNPDCGEISTSGWSKELETTRITLTGNDGMKSTIRHANPLGFKKKEALAGCADVFKELDVVPDED